MTKVGSDDEKSMGVCCLLITYAAVQLSQVGYYNNNTGELPRELVWPTLHKCLDKAMVFVLHFLWI